MIVVGFKQSFLQMLRKVKIPFKAQGLVSLSQPVITAVWQLVEQLVRFLLAGSYGYLFVQVAMVTSCAFLILL